MSTLDFWFDFSSPFAYLAATQVDALAARTGASLRWRPMLLGAVFKLVGQVDVPLFAMSAAKQQYLFKDFHRWAAWWDVPLTFPSRFPLRTLLPLRTWMAHPDPLPYGQAVFHAAWAEDRDVTDPDVLRSCGATEEVLAAAADQKQALIDSTNEAVAAGVFGAPTFVVDGKYLFWGQDRLALVERCLNGWVPPA